MSNMPGLERLFQQIDLKIQEKIMPLQHRKQDGTEAEKLSYTFSQMKSQATEGSETARAFIRNVILTFLKEDKELTEEKVDGLLGEYFVDYFENPYTGGNPANRKKHIDIEIEEYFERFRIHKSDPYEKKLKKLSQVVYQELYGYSILDELIFDSSLNEVACNRYDYIWIQYKGIKRTIPNPKFRFPDEETYQKLVEDRLTSTAAEELNRGNPIVYAILRNGSRVTAARPELSRHTVVNVRLFNYKKMAEDVRSRFLTDKMEKFIELCAKKGRRNIAIIGEQGSGKTTAADELIIQKLDDDLSIGLVENRHELGISRSYPQKNVVELQYVSPYTPSDLTEMLFRFNRDVIIYGEIRSASEAFEVIKAMLRQARGSLFTFHSSGVRRMVHDLRCLLMQTGHYFDYKTAQYDVADAVDLVIHLKLDRSTGERYVYRIAEIISHEEDLSYSIRDLFVYDKERGRYLVNREGVSNTFVESCMEYEFTREDERILRNMFSICEGEEDIYEYMEEKVLYQKDNQSAKLHCTVFGTFD